MFGAPEKGPFYPQHVGVVRNVHTNQVYAVIVADTDAELSRASAPWHTTEKRDEAVTLVPISVAQRGHQALADYLRATCGPPIPR